MEINHHCEKFFLGQARTEAKRDLACALLGCSVPAILRSRTNGYSYQLIGEADVHGIMNGEVMNWLDEGLYSLDDVYLNEASSLESLPLHNAMNK